MRKNRLRVEGASIPPGLSGTTYMDINAYGSVHVYVLYHIYTCTHVLTQESFLRTVVFRRPSFPTTTLTNIARIYERRETC